MTQRSQELGTVLDPSKCRYCGAVMHEAKLCPTIRAIEYADDGTVTRVELWALYELREMRAKAEQAEVKLAGARSE